MQILEIVLYGKNGKKRVLSFKTGEVNIITGKSRTGKSAIIDIVEYCLGRSTCKVAKGVIRDTVIWYGLLLKHENENIFVARQNPQGKQISTNFSYFQRGKNITSPDNPPDEPNTTNEGIVNMLSELIHISPNKNFPKEGQTRNALSANIKHALFTCFQKQGELTSDQVLFHRQAEQHTTQDIKDTLPYFLGAIREDELALKQEFDKQERLLRLAKQSLREAEMLKGDEVSRAQNLIAEAKDSGIVRMDKEPDTHNERIKLMKNISKTWKPNSEPLKFSDNLDFIQDQILDLNNKIGKKEQEIKASKKFASELTGFSDIVEHQKDRLTSVNLFERIHTEHDTCPLCDNKLEKDIPTITGIKKTLESLQNELEFTINERPIIRERITNLEKEYQDLQIQLKQKISDAESIIQSREPLLEQRDRNIRQAQVIAKIGFWLDNVKITDDTSNLKKNIAQLEKKVEALRQQLDEKNKNIRIESILNRIGSRMTEWSKELDLEHAKFPVRLYLPTANIMIDDDKGAFSLDQVGSAENLLGYHLITLFALHEYFIKNKRPIPQFLILDQPSQAYFPKDISKIKEDMKGYLDEDRVSVLKIFNFIFDFVDSLKGQFQIIVSDHADFEDNNRFQSSIREKWRGKNALVPYDWYE